MKKLFLTLAMFALAINLKAAADATKLVLPTNGISFMAGTKMVIEWSHSTNHLGKEVRRFAELYNTQENPVLPGGIVPIIDTAVNIPISELSFRLEWNIPVSVKPGIYTLGMFESIPTDFPGINWNSITVIIKSPRATITSMILKPSTNPKGMTAYFEAKGFPGSHYYMVQASTDLLRWFDLGGTDADKNGRVWMGVTIDEKNIVLWPILKGEKLFFRMRTVFLE